MLDALFSGIAGLLAFFYAGLGHSYFLAISALTLTVMLALFPLTLKQTRSMLAMQRLQPEMKKLQAQHKGDSQARNEAVMALYKEHGVNPMAGCLPMLLQMPVFLVLFRVLRGLSHMSGEVAQPKYVGKNTDLYRDLVASGGHMKSWGFDLAENAAAAAKHGFGHALPYFVMLILAVLSGWFQMKRMNARNPQAMQANPQAAMMQRIFPIFYGFISFNIAAGVVLYFVVSNAFRIVQQEAMYKWDPHVSAHHAHNTKVAAEAGPPPPRKKLFEAARESRQAKEVEPSNKTKPVQPQARPNGNGAGNGTPAAAMANGRAQPKGSRNRRRRKRGR